jgi:hypothetical protein
MANRMAGAIAKRMAKLMRSLWQNDAPNPNPKYLYLTLVFARPDSGYVRCLPARNVTRANRQAGR